MFVDEIILEVKAGDGGNGCLAFRREKFVDMGGPFGGNGGRGSNIVFKVDEGLNTLVDLRSQKFIHGKKGGNGGGKGKHGKGASDIVIKVPQGTIITDVTTNLIIADLTVVNEEVIVAQGGRGGRGNMAFATSDNPAPKIAENGEPGEIKKIKLELKLLADVGLVGMPSVGKSTLISRISNSRPKIANYHFTTLSPNLGVVKTIDNRSFVVADLPGLIKGASLGEGLGIQFLKHIERTRVIAHVIDMSGVEGRDPYNDYLLINEELNKFNPDLLKKPQIIIANKMDIPTFNDNLEVFTKKVDVPIFSISAQNNIGLEVVLLKLADMLDSIEKEPLYSSECFQDHILYEFKEAEPFIITFENNAWIIKSAEIEKLVKMTRFTGLESSLRFANILKKKGVDQALRELGAKEGETVKIGDYEFEYEL